MNVFMILTGVCSIMGGVHDILHRDPQVGLALIVFGLGNIILGV